MINIRWYGQNSGSDLQRFPGGDMTWTSMRSACITTPEPWTSPTTLCVLPCPVGCVGGGLSSFHRIRIRWSMDRRARKARPVRKTQVKRPSPRAKRYSSSCHGPIRGPGGSRFRAASACATADAMWAAHQAEHDAFDLLGVPLGVRRGSWGPYTGKPAKVWPGPPEAVPAVPRSVVPREARPVGAALLQECRLALHGLLGHVGEPGRLSRE